MGVNGPDPLGGGGLLHYQSFNIFNIQFTETRGYKVEAHKLSLSSHTTVRPRPSCRLSNEKSSKFERPCELAYKQEVV